MNALIAIVVVALCITIIAVTALLMGINGTLTLAAFSALGGLCGAGITVAVYKKKAAQ